MEFRFWLRFETGERSGDRVPVPAEGLTTGRRTDNGLVLSDPSVSGRHARIVVIGSTVVLEDLGSTNGTRVNDERIESAKLESGDEVRFGSVELTFHDEQGAPAPARSASASPAAPAAAPVRPATDSDELVLEGAEGELALEGGEDLGDGEDAGEDLTQVRADLLARSGSRSALAGVALLVLAAGAGAAWWFFGRGSAAEEARRTVFEVAGNLLANPSFEREGGWEDDDSAPDSFFSAPAWRVSGEAGLGASLEPESWARAWSQSVSLSASRGLRFTGTASASGGATLNAGVELSSSGGLFPALTVWAPPVTEASGGELEFALSLPPLAGCDRARVVLRARAGSAPDAEASVDDLALVLVDAGDGARAPAGRFQETELHLLGDPPTSAALTRIDRVLLGDFGLHGDGAEARSLALTARADEAGVLLAGTGAQRMTATVSPAVARQGVVTLGAGGYRTHPLDFEVEGVTDLLVGDRLDLLRFRFQGPVTVTGRALGGAPGGALAIEARGTGAAEVFLQLQFRDERNRAASLAEVARAAEASGDLSVALERWGELLDELPFDALLVKAAGDTRARLIQQGLDEADELAAANERAQFFQLPELYREVRASAVALAERYAKSPVEDVARALVLAVDTELAGLARDGEAADVQRLEGVLQAAGDWAADGGAASPGDGPLGAHLREELERLRAEPRDAGLGAEAPHDAGLGAEAPGNSGRSNDASGGR